MYCYQSSSLGFQFEVTPFIRDRNFSLWAIVHRILLQLHPNPLNRNNKCCVGPQYLIRDELRVF